MNFFIFLHFVIATIIICLVLIQRSAESSILVSSVHFTPGGANKLLVKITKCFVIMFIFNCLLISYLKNSKNIISSSDIPVKTDNSKSIPVD